MVRRKQHVVQAAKRQRGKKLVAGTAEAVSSSETGIRRCTRVKSRPVAFWKGERFIHELVDNRYENVVDELKDLGTRKKFLPQKKVVHPKKVVQQQITAASHDVCLEPSPGPGPNPDMNYKSRYMESKKKVEALVAENYDLVKKLQLFMGKNVAYLHALAAGKARDGPRE